MGCFTLVDAQPRIKVYPQNIRIDKGKSRTFTALAFDSAGRYLPNMRFAFTRASGRVETAVIRPSPEGDTEGNTSRSSMNLAEVSGLDSGTATFIASADGIQSSPVTVTVVDPANSPTSVITTQDGGIVGNTILARVGEAVEVSAETSSGVASLEWSWGDGDKTNELLSAVHAYLYEGTYALKLRITNSSGIVSESTVTVVVSGFPPPTRTFTVTTSAQLLAAYLQCTGGEHIIIPAGTILSGGIELPARSFTDFVTIKSSATMPEMGFRVSPTRSDLAVIRGSFTTDIPLLIKNRSSKIRLSGIKFEPFNGGSTFQNYYLLQIGDPFQQNSVEDNPSRIIIDHCVIAPPDGVQVVHGVLNDGYKISVISSWLGNIKTYGGQDSQAVFGLDGRGAHVYSNTYFEAASESIIYGGAPGHIDGNVPTNIEFRRCVFTKPLAWRDSPPNSQGETINVKNLFETKNARRLYVEGSVFSNHWDADRSQFYAIVLKSSADLPGGGQGSPWAVSEDIVFENNQLSHMNGAMSISRDFRVPGVVYDAIKPSEITILNTLFHDLTFGRWGTQRGWVFYTSGVDDLTIKHVTVVDSIETPNEQKELLLSLNSINSYRPDISDSILPLNYYGIRNTCGEGSAAMNVGTSGWFDLPTGNSCGAVSGQNAGSWRVAGNVFPVMRTFPVTGAYPLGNFYPANYSATGMQAYRGCSLLATSDLCEAVPANYLLNGDSSYKGRATDGSDPGINVELLTNRIRCTAGGDTRPCVTVPGAPTPLPTPTGLEGDLATGPNGDGIILPNDLVRVRSFVSGAILPSPGSNEFQRADTAPFASRGDGQLTAADIIQARNYILGINLPEPAAGPATPQQQSPKRLSGESNTSVIRIIPTKLTERVRATAFVEISSDRDIEAVSFTLRFDPKLLRDPNVTLGPDADPGTMLTTNTIHAADGILGVVLDSNRSLNDAGRGSRIIEISFSTLGEMSIDSGRLLFTSDLVIGSAADGRGEDLPIRFIDGNLRIKGSKDAKEGLGETNRVS